MIHVIQQYASIGDFLHVSHVEMECNEDHELGKVVLVQASFACCGSAFFLIAELVFKWQYFVLGERGVWPTLPLWGCARLV